MNSSSSTDVPTPGPLTSERKHIAVFNVPQPGHVNPTLGLVAELVARGHRVSYALTDDFRTQVEAVGATLVAYRPTDTEVELPEDLVAGAILAFRQVLSALPELAVAFSDDVPDVVLYDVSAAAGGLLAAYWQVPAIRLSPSHLPYEGVLPEMYGVPDLTHVPELDEARGLLTAHGLNMTLEELLLEPEHAVAFLPRAFQRKPDAVTARAVTYAGPGLTDRSYQGSWTPPADGRPVLLVSLGTQFTRRPEFYQACVDAFADSHWHVVMAVGNSVDPEGFASVPASMEIMRRVPQLDVLSHAAAFVTHGGMGSVMGALAHGVPLVVVPQMSEQLVNARQVEHLSLGRHLPREEATPQALRDAVDTVTTDPEVTRGVAALRQAIEEAGGAATGADAVEKVLASVITA
ncbi:macrolide family glycosyltransferase [Streptomyces sp. NPDC001584]|uniref:macrolide family glycosyltransferase n=1 Tax=Streptomyces sp. NPDC001584 TaxID=3154521 RepID=UPI00332511A3